MLRRINKGEISSVRALGFTLVELMAVLFIFMLVATVIVINTNLTVSSQQRVANAADTLLAKIRLARQTAIFQQIPLRLAIEENQIGFQKFQLVQDEYQWMWVTQDAILAPEKLEKELRLQQQGQVELYPNGRITPFSIVITNDKGNAHYTIKGTESGELGLSKG